ncbi:MAG: hypothetical protein BGO55_08930 [Sphingobacteriales bacterium 50-39]|nr:MAG: hypothetical protein BGO55_08930 [Sphingobacteriales bacterium 50-39]
MARSMRIICRDEGLEAPKEVNSCRDLLSALKEEYFSHLVLDLTLADGNAMEILDSIVVRYPALKIIVYSDKPVKLYGQILRKRYGIRFVPKNEKEEIALQRLLAFFKDQDVEVKPISDLSESPFDLLTAKERELLPYLLRGLSPIQIGQQIGKTSSAVRTHKQSILEKTDTENVVELKELAALYNVSVSSDNWTIVQKKKRMRF